MLSAREGDRPGFSEGRRLESHQVFAAILGLGANCSKQDAKANSGMLTVKTDARPVTALPTITSG